MKLLRYIIPISFSAAWVLGQSAHRPQPSTVPDEPESVVRSLYREVVTRAPSGLPGGADVKIFAPYLSQAMLHRIASARACSRDWVRQNEGRVIKAPFSWSEAGIFSGANERTAPGNFQIEKTQADKDAAFRVDVKLTYRPADGPGFWRVAAIVKRRADHFVVDDVIYLKNRPDDVEQRMSEILSEGCDGPRWVGYGNKGLTESSRNK